MRYKNDWPEARERLAALWEGRRMDRPCISVIAPSGKAVPRPAAATQEQRWADPRWIVPDALASMEYSWWGGEAIPSYLVMCGWMVCFGGDVEFRQETIWHKPVRYDFDRPPNLTFDPQTPRVKQHEACYLAMAEAAGKDDFLVGQPCILPACDLLSMQMGAETFLTALIDHPQWMRQAILQGAHAQIVAYKYLQRLVKPRHEFWYGNAGWLPFWAPQPFSGMQADVSCMMSPAQFDEFILPEVEVFAQQHGALWYHLDGADARQHLPTLLSIPQMRVIQYTPAPREAPNGLEHLEFYHKVQAAGRIVHIQLPKENVLPLLRKIDPGLVVLDTRCGSIAEGHELLESAKDCVG